ncbi:MAG: 2OG-Fe(II) oxygenase [Verrucomicrobia bacterium]|nr:2OG-Fe(II) oxygenase [Verrucomicrobiota bacterium]
MSSIIFRFFTLFFFQTTFLSLLQSSIKEEVFVNPGDQIIIIEDFISTETADTLIEFYNSEKKDLNQNSDNQLTLHSSSNPYIQKIIFNISREILQIMKKSYELSHKIYQVDHFALYSRIAGNYCVYHSDNIMFDCPIHGKDQSKLRTSCKGNCPGAKFVPNHTPWREYTALLYLNDDFEGGEILFEDGPQNKLYKKIIPIRSGMLVIAPNGKDFYHEVFPVRKGKRHSLIFWYTSDPRHFNTFIN